MTKITELHKRWSRNRATKTTTPPQERPESRQLRHAEASQIETPDAIKPRLKIELATPAQEHVASQQSEIGTKDPLCERCLALQIGSHEERLGKVRFGKIAGVTLSSLQPQCQLCHQFRELFSTAASVESQNVTVPDFDLSCPYFRRS